MNFRKISIIAGVAVLIAAIFIGRMLSSGKEEKAFTPTARTQAVKVLPVYNKTINAFIPVTGKLEARNKIEIFSEVAGIYRQGKNAFKEGINFSKGDLLIKIESDEAFQSLLAQRSNFHNTITQAMPDLKLDYPEVFEKWDKYLQQFDVREPLKPLPEAESDREKYFITARNIYNQYFTIKSQEERLSKYFIYAPFSGVVAESTVNPGTLIRVNQKLGEYIDPSIYDLVTTIALKDLNFINVGDKVSLKSSDIKGNWVGKVSRISDKIDASTQSVNVFITVCDQRLKEGMFLTGQINIGKIEKAVKIPRNILVDENSIFIVRDSILRKETVNVVRFVEDSAIIKGVEDGTPVMNESLPGAFEGMKVQPNLAGK